MYTLVFVDGDQVSPSSAIDIIKNEFKNDKVVCRAFISGMKRYKSHAPQYLNSGYEAEYVSEGKDAADVCLMLSVFEKYLLMDNISKIAVLSNDHIYAHLFKYIRIKSGNVISCIGIVKGNKTTISDIIKKHSHHVVYY